MKMKSILTLLITCCMIFALTGCDSDSSSAGGPDLSGQHLGWIMYSDGTYTQEYDSSKTAIGIIVECDDDTGKPEKIVMAEVSSDLAWGSMTGETYHVGTGDDGDENLNRVQMAGLGSGNFPIFDDVMAIADFDSANWKKWYIPSYEEMVEDIYRNRTQIEAAVTKLGGVSNIVLDQDYWTSNENNTDFSKAWIFNPATKSGSTVAKSTAYPVFRMTELKY